MIANRLSAVPRTAWFGLAFAVVALAVGAFLIGPPPDRQPETSAEAVADSGGDPVSINDPVQGRAFDALVWHPADGSERNELVVVSHGFAGDKTSHSHLARGLADLGYTVIAPTHPDLAGLESNDPTLDPLLLRPRHLTLAIDEIEADSGRSFDSVTVVGHSLGAYSALRLAGAEPEPGELLATHCDATTDDVLCSPRSRSRFEASGLTVDETDNRVTGVVLLAPGYGPLFAAEQLAVTAPVHLVAAATDAELPGGQVESLLDRLPPDTSSSTVEGGHYVFLRPCTDAEAEAAPVVCDTSDGVDRAAVERAAVNRDLVDRIDRFIRA